MAFDPITEGFSLVSTVLNKFFPDANEELRGKLSQASAEIDNTFKLQIAQLEINKEEAKSNSLFIAGARPFIIWVGGLGLAYQLLFQPIVNGILLVLGFPAVFTLIDVTLLQTTLGTLLGLGVARSVDKVKGVDTKFIGKKK